MKRIRYILTLLTAVLCMISGITAEAATIKKELAAGTKFASMTLEVKNYQSVDGKISVKSKTETKKITLQSVKAFTNDKEKTVVCETANGKIFVVSNGEPVTTTVTIDVSFSGDGEYVVTLKGGCTDKDGKYKADGINETIKVVVGAFEASEDDVDEEDNDDKDDEKDDTKEEEKDTTQEDDKKVDEKDKSSLKDSKPSVKPKSEKTVATSRESVKELEDDERIIEQFLEQAEEEYKEKKAEKEEEAKKSTPKSIGSFLNYLKNLAKSWLFLISITQ